MKEVYDKVCKNIGPDFPIIAASPRLWTAWTAEALQSLVCLPKP
ncbi:MAG: hypothetical protein DUD39_03150 [Coriobacteriaceae bacterium]|nr:MAG: hypothetical protein DUD39_03150 [Coriobacteriaceae bacterium]